MNVSRILSQVLLMSSLGAGLASNAKEPLSVPMQEYYQGQLPADVKIIVSDWDKVISVPNKWARWTGMAKAILPRLNLAKLLLQPQVREDIRNARKYKVQDKDGNSIELYGAGKYIEFFADKYDPAIAELRKPLVDALASVNPIASTLAIYSKLGLPIAVWTNNDRESYEAKLVNLNNQLKEMTLHPVISFVVEQDPKLMDDSTNVQGKPEESYFLKAYDYTKKTLNLGDNDVMLFIDDMKKNVDGARETAKKFNLPLIAIQYTTPEQLEKDFALLLSPVQEPSFIDPKELDEYLYNRDARVEQFNS